MSIFYKGKVSVSGKVSHGNVAETVSDDGTFDRALVSSTYYTVSGDTATKTETIWSGNALTGPADESGVGTLDKDLTTTIVLSTPNETNRNVIMGMAEQSTVDAGWLTETTSGFGIYLSSTDGIRYDNCSYIAGPLIPDGVLDGEYTLQWVASEGYLYITHAGGTMVIRPSSTFLSTVSGLPVHIGFTLYEEETSATALVSNGDPVDPPPAYEPDMTRTFTDLVLSGTLKRFRRTNNTTQGNVDINEIYGESFVHLAISTNGTTDTVEVAISRDSAIPQDFFDSVEILDQVFYTSQAVSFNGSNTMDGGTKNALWRWTIPNTKGLYANYDIASEELGFRQYPVSSPDTVTTMTSVGTQDIGTSLTEFHGYRRDNAGNDRGDVDSNLYQEYTIKEISNSWSSFSNQYELRFKMGSHGLAADQFSKMVIAGRTFNSADAVHDPNVSFGGGTAATGWTWTLDEAIAWEDGVEVHFYD